MPLITAVLKHRSGLPALSSRPESSVPCCDRSSALSGILRPRFVCLFCMADPPSRGGGALLLLAYLLLSKPQHIFAISAENFERPFSETYGFFKISFFQSSHTCMCISGNFQYHYGGLLQLRWESTALDFSAVDTYSLYLSEIAEWSAGIWMFLWTILNRDFVDGCAYLGALMAITERSSELEGSSLCWVLWTI